MTVRYRIAGFEECDTAIGECVGNLRQALADGKDPGFLVITGILAFRQEMPDLDPEVVYTLARLHVMLAQAPEQPF